MPQHSTRTHTHALSASRGSRRTQPSVCHISRPGFWICVHACLLHIRPAAQQFASPSHCTFRLRPTTASCLTPSPPSFPSFSPLHTNNRYKKPADWALINRVAAAASVPVLGNGDLLTHYEVTRRRADHEAQPHAAAAAVHALMVGRGALVKPWLWEEVKLGRELCLTEADRVGVYRRLVSHMKDHFGDDARGRRSAWYFLPWHFSFFHR